MYCIYISFIPENEKRNRLLIIFHGLITSYKYHNFSILKTEAKKHLHFMQKDDSWNTLI